MSNTTWGINQDDDEVSWGGGLHDARDAQAAYEQQWREATVPGAQRPAAVATLWRPSWDQAPKPDPTELGHDAQPAPGAPTPQPVPSSTQAQALGTLPAAGGDNSLLLLLAVGVALYFFMGKK